MSSCKLLLRPVSPLVAKHGRGHIVPHGPLSIVSSSICTFRASNGLLRSRFAMPSKTPLSSPHARALDTKNVVLILSIPQKQFYSRGRNSWQRKSDWKAALKTGGLVLLGTGALVASTSLAFGLILAGAAGYGVYTLYQRLRGPYRSRSNDVFRNLNSNIDTLNNLLNRSRPRTSKAPVQDDLNAFLQSMPFMVRGFVKTVFSFVGKAMQHSIKRAREVKRQTEELLRANKRVCDEMGDDVSVGTPEQWIESTVNGEGTIEATFPVYGSYNSAHVSLKALVNQGGELNLTKLTCTGHDHTLFKNGIHADVLIVHLDFNRQSGKQIDLLRDTSIRGRQKTVIDAEYVDLDKKNKAQW
ncbi:hypothetical protein CCR75_004131 [Bremia lactucae]|uniref:Uncharacterized protein n=1 Tax=Bremia lactucae TaxID=4779 RepID=A0A976IDA6_BRELC|nr:hypothetical protein CCR75_004131 [Bremia lactucae]